MSGALNPLRMAQRALGSAVRIGTPPSNRREAELRVVMVEVGQQHRVGPEPGRWVGPTAAPHQKAVVPPQQWVGDDANTVDVHDDGGVTQPGDHDAHGAFPLRLVCSR